jgi:hypothetical protein
MWLEESAWYVLFTNGMAVLHHMRIDFRCALADKLWRPLPVLTSSRPVAPALIDAAALLM